MVVANAKVTKYLYSILIGTRALILNFVTKISIFGALLIAIKGSFLRLSYLLPLHFVTFLYLEANLYLKIAQRPLKLYWVLITTLWCLKPCCLLRFPAVCTA